MVSPSSIEMQSIEMIKDEDVKKDRAVNKICQCSLPQCTFRIVIRNEINASSAVVPEHVSKSVRSKTDRSQKQSGKAKTRKVILCERFDPYWFHVRLLFFFNRA